MATVNDLNPNQQIAYFDRLSAWAKSAADALRQSFIIQQELANDGNTAALLETVHSKRMARIRAAVGKQPSPDDILAEAQAETAQA